MQWKLVEAENNFNKIANLALSEGPQEVVCEESSILVIAKTEYERATGKKIVFKPDFKAALMGGPGFKDLDLEREVAPGREVIL